MSVPKLTKAIDDLGSSVDKAGAKVIFFNEGVKGMNEANTAAIQQLTQLTEQGNQAAAALSAARHATDQCTESLQVFTDRAGSAFDAMARLRSEAGQMGQALAESGTAAARNAIAITQMTTSVYDANQPVKELTAHLDGLVTATPMLTIYMNDLVNRFKDGQISAATLNQAVQQLKQGLDYLNQVGGGFMGDIDGAFYKMLGTINDIIKALGTGPGGGANTPGGKP